jgi:hypothetical protein
MGVFTHFKASIVPNINYFRCDKGRGKIVKQTIRRLFGAPTLVFTIETPIVENIHGYPLVIASTGVGFIQAFEQNLKDMVKELEDYKDKVNILEEEAKFYKSDRTIIFEFKTCSR